ncbi:MAG: dipeptidase [Undibacterium sp.]|nr:dipeptidase [Opitutaceae bacterium]
MKHPASLPLLTLTLAALPAALPAADDARAIHERLITFDTHLDTPANFSKPGWDIMDRHSYETDRSQVDYPRMVQGGLDGGFWAIFTAQGPRTPEGLAAARDKALMRGVEIREMVAKHSDKFELAFDAADAARIHAAGKRVVYMSVENSYPIGKDISLIQTFYTLGVRMMSPAHTSNNDLADSATDTNGSEWQGLSPLGKEFVAECNPLGIILGASHSADSVFDQMLELSKTPLILSHSGPKGANNHPRNIDDERIKQLAAKGGVIQINSLSGYLIPQPVIPERNAALAQLYVKFGLPAPQARGAGGAGGGAAGGAGRGGRGGRGGSLEGAQRTAFMQAMGEIDEHYPLPQATFEDYMRHILYTLKLVGPEHVGFGADWDGGGGVEGMRDITGCPKITERLLKEGYTEKDLANMWSGNVIRLLKAAEDCAAKTKN